MEPFAEDDGVEADDGVDEFFGCEEGGDAVARGGAEASEDFGDCCGWEGDVVVHCDDGMGVLMGIPGDWEGLEVIFHLYGVYGLRLNEASPGSKQET